MLKAGKHMLIAGKMTCINAQDPVLFFDYQRSFADWVSVKQV